jgi:phenylpropionate dioxygenase-like ring-hydroxylating dioxygenase large terminal subunit
MGALIVLGRELPAPAKPPRSGPAWIQARPAWIAGAVAAAQAKPSGGWFVLDGSRRITARPRCFVVAGAPLVVFRDHTGHVIAGPDACPHLGARLSEGRTERSAVVCPWHGLRLGGRPRGSWRPVPTHDDGVLVWARLGEPAAFAAPGEPSNPGEPDAPGAPAEPLTDRPILPARPDAFVAGVVRAEARCEPRDVLANRFDPWHGTHFHPYSFARLEVLELGEDHVVVRVAKRIAGPLAVEVDARFDSPERRTIVMTIVEGEGEGSVVETHATPIEPGRTAIVEASLATSTRPGFAAARRLLAPLIRPLLERSARRLWVDDRAYAERLYQIRARQARSHNL